MDLYLAEDKSLSKLDGCQGVSSESQTLQVEVPLGCQVFSQQDAGSQTSQVEVLLGVAFSHNRTGASIRDDLFL